MDKVLLNDESFKVLLNADKETEHLEFKLAESSFNFNIGKKSLCGYSIALANEGGGRVILGVTDKKPRQVIGTNAFKDIGKLEKDLFVNLNRRIFVQELVYLGKRVLIINVPSRPIGEALELEGQYLMRIKDELVAMSPDKIKEIVNESVYDFSSKIMQEATFKDLSSGAITELRKLLSKSSRVSKDINAFNDKQLLQDLGLIDKEKITVAAIILLGSHTAVKRYLPYAEIRYGYKSDEKEIRNQDSVVYDEGYLLYYQRLWEKIDSRNLALHIPQGLTLIEKKVFDEETIRESINNAIIHRDYSESETTILMIAYERITTIKPIIAHVIVIFAFFT